MTVTDPQWADTLARAVRAILAIEAAYRSHHRMRLGLHQTHRASRVEGIHITNGRFDRLLPAMTEAVWRMIVWAERHRPELAAELAHQTVQLWAAGGVPPNPTPGDRSRYFGRRWGEDDDTEQSPVTSPNVTPIRARRGVRTN